MSSLRNAVKRSTHKERVAYTDAVKRVEKLEADLSKSEEKEQTMRDELKVSQQTLTKEKQTAQQQRFAWPGTTAQRSKLNAFTHAAPVRTRCGRAPKNLAPGMFPSVLLPLAFAGFAPVCTIVLLRLAQ